MSEELDVRELGKQLPWDRPDAARRDALRSSLLVAATERADRPRARWYVIGGAFAAGAIAAAAAVLLFFRGPTPQPPSAAQIETSAAASVERQVTRTPTGTDEVVSVHGGTVTVRVGALRAGDHVRVATRDGEVEGEGQYQVDVASDQLRGVDVREGHATVRVSGQHAVFLSAGESWRATAITARVDVVPAVVRPATPATTEHVESITPTPTEPTVAKPHVSVPKSAAKRPAPDHVDSVPPAAVVDTPRPAEPTPVKPVDPGPEPTKTESPAKQLEAHFKTGMQLLKAGQAAAAARELGAAADASPDDPLAADARYFQAVALTKAGRKTEAEKALVGFLDRAPKSIRRGRAAVMLGRLIAERGDNTAARAWFESALDDADASVVAAARAGIAALH